MPHSHPEGKEWAADFYAVVKPQVVVDIGPGAGMWHDALHLRHGAFWIGVEIWEPYIAAYDLLHKYNRIIVRDARDYVGDVHALPNTGLFILGDVLEHMPQDNAEHLLKTLFSHTSAHVLVSVPINHYEQGELEGNPHEAHLWYPTHEWAMDLLHPDAYMKGAVVGTYWSSP